MNKNVSRRSFVTGATGVGAFAALAGLAGCNQKKGDGGQKASGEKKKSSPWLPTLVVLTTSPLTSRLGGHDRA